MPNIQKFGGTLITRVLDVSDEMKNRRDYRDVLMTLVEEVGELSTEIAIDSGHKNREPGVDGIIGEALDVIIAAVDIIHLAYKHTEYTNASIESLLMSRAGPKLEKWELSVQKGEK